MTIWRLIAHHEDPDAAIAEMKRRNRIAIGWSDVGDLSKAKVSRSSDITQLISETHHPIENTHLGGPSLWNIYYEMQKGDMVILNARSRRKCVFQVIGSYVFEADEGQILGYAHQRSACLTSMDADTLWEKAGNVVAKGQNIRWTLAACSDSKEAEHEIYKEGIRYSISSTAIERNPAAREACIEYYGAKCDVCMFDFSKAFGELGAGYIHVHHRLELSSRVGEYSIDPVEDLIPLCPNCHAMAHRRRPAVSLEELKEIYWQRQV